MEILKEMCLDSGQWVYHCRSLHQLGMYFDFGGVRLGLRDLSTEGAHEMSIHVQVRVGVEWINDFHPEACQQNNLSYCDDQVVGFYNHMGSHGHVKVFNWGDDNAWETDFRHPDFGGDSLNWSDDVHFCMVNDHGGNSANIVSFFSPRRTRIAPCLPPRCGSARRT